MRFAYSWLSVYTVSNLEPDLRGQVAELKRQLANAEAERAQVLAQLQVARESVAKWQRIMEEADVPIAIHEGPDHIFRFTNERYNQITGNRDCIGQPKRESFPELGAQGVFERFDEVYRTGKRVRLPVLRFRSHQSHELSEAYFTQVLQPWRNAAGEIAGVMSISHDVTDQARARQRAEQSLRLFQATGENIPYGVWWCGHDGGIAYFSPSLLEFTGKNMEEVAGYQWLGLLPQDEVEPTRKAWQRTLEAKEVWEHEYQIRGKDGEYSTVLSLGRPILSEHGDLLAYAGLNIDITDRKEAEQELKRAKEAADAANRAKSAFLANMSHDIRTPLTAIIGYSEVLSTRVHGQESEIVKQIYNACRHLQTILDSVLKYARLESGVSKLQTQSELLAPQLTQTCEMLLPNAREHGVRLELRVQDPEIRARIDIGAFNRVLTNLIDNAIKYSSSGQPVIVSLSRSGDAACVSVKDFGIGMSESFKRHLFEPFTQEREKQPPSATGAGLGMAITRQLLSLMDGRIEVDTCEGEGSEFRVYLPAGDATGVNGFEKGEKREEPVQAAAKVIASPRVLVCEDSSNTRQVLRYMLADYNVEFATTEEELFEKFDHHDIVLLDINIGGRNIGGMMLERLRQMEGGRESHVVAFTAHSLPGQLEEFLAAGFDDYLAKPFTKRELLHVINSSIDA